MKALILAGGSGTRLWPLSRKNYPKQFLILNDTASLLQQTARRLLNVVSPDDLIVMTNEQYRFYVGSDLKDMAGASGDQHGFHMVLEPAGRNTAPAIALGIKYCLEKLGCSGDEIVFVSPSDHVIRPDDRFAEYLRLAESEAEKGFIVTFGIRPERPETGYGYIMAGEGHEISAGQLPDRPGREYFRVEKFVEKPDHETAVRYLDEGNYYWNSGMFAFSISTMVEELEKHAPAISEFLGMSYEEMIAGFEKMPAVSIDYAVMEKSDRVVTAPLDIYWNDIGSWDSIYDVMDKDDKGNVTKGDVLTTGTEGSLILGNKRLIAAIGMEDCLIVETDDAILISKKGEAQKVRDIVRELNRTERKEAIEHVTTYRPWGSYTVLEEGPRYKIKRIVVNTGERLSLQMHCHRSEHWVVVSGTARVTIGEKEIFIHENESAYVPKSTLHRLENPGKVPLEIIEVQNGEYVGEDDIERFDDRYGRHTTP
ncbi:alginate biosynthesis protein AlgA [bacterium BMS3Bbin05]|nr:alginate biosynthesis protein AlgA [bacterium BMS3Bbin05]HDL20154.1 mannose-1-phosphate guanylyltransferase/mannose-6-phosphate isomerase [Nitrospirota bacterium]HDO22980.1 mannose-1-phosphate guanylyltransferase/mannose-6-phosphate isomerase [Nitrospirota bacterium]HDZ87094.1 mannose-1-phosphate guanylyltransferase/mannose-6-phosphate isomerase [Nitrospirota bacterium]